mmetsp:Transcript_22907/g.58427  ORF Transcript_22907/g.58427 Transcript_22907/m.58427 type:complete len:256 (+) Transcript_22907:1673-2440(+)
MLLLLLLGEPHELQRSAELPGVRRGHLLLLAQHLLLRVLRREVGHEARVLLGRQLAVVSPRRHADYGIGLRARQIGALPQAVRRVARCAAVHLVQDLGRVLRRDVARRPHPALASGGRQGRVRLRARRPMDAWQRRSQAGLLRHQLRLLAGVHRITNVLLLCGGHELASLSILAREVDEVAARLARAQVPLERHAGLDLADRAAVGSHEDALVPPLLDEAHAVVAAGEEPRDHLVPRVRGLLYNADEVRALGAPH